MDGRYQGPWPSEAELGYGLGHRLQTVREEQRLSKAELARRLGLSRSSITKYEAGVHVPAVRVLARLALGLRVSADYLLGLSATAVPVPWVDGELAQHLRQLDHLDDVSRARLLPLIRSIADFHRLVADRVARAEASR